MMTMIWKYNKIITILYHCRGRQLRRPKKTQKAWPILLLFTAYAPLHT